jgi:hypothetical protein
MTSSRRPGPVHHDPFSDYLAAQTPGPTGINALAERGDTPGPLGTGQDHAQLLANGRPAHQIYGRTPHPRHRKPAKKTKKDLNIFGDYKPGPYTKDADILAAVKAGKDDWFPSSIELRKFAASGRGVVEGAVNVWNVLCLIYRHKPDRVNLFVHGNEGYIGLSGEVTRGNVDFSPDPDAQFSAETIQKAEEEGWSFSDKKSKGVTMEMVHAALPKGAEIVIYSCHSGTSKEELKRLARLLKVKVSGFTEEIRYYPISVDGKTIVSWEYSAGKGTRVKDFHELQPDVSVPP